MNVLIVDDDAVKFGNLVNCLEQAGVSRSSISHAVNAADAISKIRSTQFSLMLLDVNLPRRSGEPVSEGGGLLVLKEMSDDKTLFRPSYVVGVTAYRDAIDRFSATFIDQLWSIVHYREDITSWSSQIGALVRHINLAVASGNFSDGVTYGYDIGIICALPDVELGALRAIDLGWSELKLHHDETLYITGNIQTKQGLKSVVAAAAPRMGMPASAVLASKMIAQFRPALLAMSGICAGRHTKTNLGDVVIADPAWDYGSGRITGTAKGPVFTPSAHQLNLDPDWAALALRLSEDVEWLARLKNTFMGPKPDTELKLRIGPMASGAAVVADKTVFMELISRQKNVLAVEMEAYAVLASGLGSGKPRPITIVLKGVCDFADKKKSDDYQAYAAFNSASILIELIRRNFD